MSKALQSSSTADIARAAEVELGYLGLRRKLGVPGPLEHTLAQLGIGILPPEAVRVNQRARSAATGESWHRHSLKKYAGPVPPADVLEKALEISRALPETRFFVEALGADPYLIAVWGDEEFYLDVWGEEGK